MTHTNSRPDPVFGIALGLTVPSLLLLWRSGFLPEQLSDWRTPAMYAELLLMAALLFLAEKKIRDRRPRAVAEALLVCGRMLRVIHIAVYYASDRLHERPIDTPGNIADPEIGIDGYSSFFSHFALLSRLHDFVW